MLWLIIRIAATIAALTAPAKAETACLLPELICNPLATARSSFADELAEQATTNRLWRLTEAEVGSQGEAAAQAFIETVLNRAHARGQSLARTMNDASYYPAVSLRGREPTDERAAMYARLLIQVREGSNVSNYATGNASGSVQFNGGPLTFSSDGERFGIEGPDRLWAASFSVGQELPTVTTTLIPDTKPRSDDIDRPRRIARKASRNNDDDKPKRRNRHRDSDDDDD